MDDIWQQGVASVGAYRKFGFQETAPEQVMNGIRFTPMIIHPSEKLQT